MQVFEALGIRVEVSPRLPILLDYSETTYQPLIPNKYNLALAAMGDRGRVRGIIIRLGIWNHTVPEALSQLFSELQSLDIDYKLMIDICLILPASFFSGPALGL